MAFCILVEKNSTIDWLQINREIVPYKTQAFNFFPIVMNGYNAIGITIVSQYKSIDKFAEILQKLILMLIKEDFSIFELYSGKEITAKNINYLLDFFL